MIALLETFEERLQEIETYLDLLDAIEQQVRLGPPKIGEALVTTQQQKILYSAVFLQLYNLVEATITWCVGAVSAAVTDNGRWYPYDLSAELRREWVRSAARTHIDLSYDKRLQAAFELCELLLKSLPIPNWEVEIGRRGNWDDNEISVITDRLGLDLKISREAYKGVKQPFREDKGPLALVKYLRNRLAHGSMSFAECGEGVTVTDLRDLKQRTALYLREVVSAFKSYIDAYEFLIPERRPAAGMPH
jgi:hypothetical protein